MQIHSAPAESLLDTCTVQRSCFKSSKLFCFPLTDCIAFQRDKRKLASHLALDKQNANKVTIPGVLPKQTRPFQHLSNALGCIQTAALSRKAHFTPECSQINKEGPWEALTLRRWPNNSTNSQYHWLSSLKQNKESK